MTQVHAVLAPGVDLALRPMEVPEGLNVAQIIALACPGVTPRDHATLRVTLVNDAVARVVAPQLWAHVRPKPGTRVVLRLVPAADQARAVLLTVVSVAAVALAPTIAGSILSIDSAIGASLVAGGLSIAGAALVNALVPIKTPTLPDRARARYELSGWSNEERPGQPVPEIFGKHRVAPPLAASSYSEIVGDDQYIRALFCFGYGALDISEIRIGDTPIEDFEDVELEIRPGTDSDAPITLYPRQVLEEQLGVELVRPLPRDSAGEVTEGAATETPISRFTATDSQLASVILTFANGLFEVTNSGETRPLEVVIRIRQRLNGGDWQNVQTLSIIAATRTGFHRQHSWALPSRGQWEIEVTRMTDERVSTQVSDRVIFGALQSMRPEYPINLTTPLALLAVRIRATYQLNGRLDAVNAVVQRRLRDWSGGGWAMGLSRNPASAYLAALQSPSNPYPVADAAIDFDALADWHGFCADKGLKYDAVHDSPQSLGDVLATIAQAGRASPRHDGLRWGVVVDRPQELVVDHLSPRNAQGFQWSRRFTNPPDAFRVRFADETSNWEPAERIIPWPGHEGAIDLTEELALPGKTDPDEIWREARRRMYEVMHRAETYTLTQDGAARVATRGDLVVAAFDVLDRTQAAARIRAVEGRVVELDQSIEFDAGTDYGIRFRTFSDAEDSLGQSIVSPLHPLAGPSRLVRLKGTGETPGPGTLVHLGPLGQVGARMRVAGIEPGEGFAARLTLLPEADIIDTLTDAEVPPAWDGRVGSVIALSVVAPATPRIQMVKSILTWFFGTPESSRIFVTLTEGTGSSVAATSYRIYHRLAGSGAFTAETVAAATGGVQIDVYNAGDVVEIYASALAADGSESGATDIITHEVGSSSPALPAALDPDAIVVTGGLGRAHLSVAVADDGVTRALCVLRVPPGDSPDESLHAIGDPISITPGSTVTIIDGDATRDTLLSEGEFNAQGAWFTGAGWTIANGKAQHTVGTTASLSQPISTPDGSVARMAIEVTGRTTGAATPALLGAVDQTGLGSAEDGTYVARLTADSTTGFGVQPDSSFDGAIEQAVLFLETSACAPQGQWDYYIAPQNVEGVSGPAAGPFSVLVI